MMSIALLFTSFLSVHAQTEPIEERLNRLIEQNEQLLRLVQSQQAEIEDLKKRMDSLDEADQQQVEEISEIRQDMEYTDVNPHPSGSSLLDNIHVSGEAGIAFFAGESNTQFPNDEFRVDDAKLWIEARVTDGVYLVSELEIHKRESGPDTDFDLGELYVEIENVIPIPGMDRLFNLRAGRVDIPFGLEYLHRDVMANPLITHSVADFWGIDEGLELFGEWGNWSYVLAVQNGGISRTRDFDSDKSITVRMNYAFNNQVTLSASYLNTGNLDLKRDETSEFWIANGVFLSPDQPQPTKFGAEVFQVETQLSWKTGNIWLTGGQAWYDDNLTSQDNSRTFDFGMLELKQNLSEKWYGVARYSYMEADKPYILRGLGSFRSYILEGTLSTKVERLALGMGYWVQDDVLLKIEYALEEGTQADGTERSEMDQFSAELGVRF